MKATVTESLATQHSPEKPYLSTAVCSELTDIWRLLRDACAALEANRLRIADAQLGMQDDALQAVLQQGRCIPADVKQVEKPFFH